MKFCTDEVIESECYLAAATAAAAAAAVAAIIYSAYGCYCVVFSLLS